MADGKHAVDARESSTPPCVVKISDLKQGAGACRPTGSGDDACANGNNATSGGGCDGNNDTGWCNPNGNSAEICGANGSSPVHE